MCGICGMMAYKSAKARDIGALRDLRERMANRGPDGKGEWISANGAAWLGHRRLAIMDLSERGSQPMVTADGRLAVTFNGEIYNYRELRQSLEARGHRFKSASDTEVLLELYRAEGVPFVSRLRGMFAFALWDEEAQRLLLARDPYGIKPLYYADRKGQLIFASSAKALARHPSTGQNLEPAGLVGFFLFGSVPDPWTIYQNVMALPAGTFMVVDRNGPAAPTHYHSIASAIAEAEIEAGEQIGRAPIEQLKEALLDSVQHHLQADVPVGAFLSGGVDSGALVGLMRDAGQDDIQTITLSFREFHGLREDEAPFAEAVAKHYRTRHTTRRISKEEFETDLPRIFEAMDQPSIDGINSWFVSKAARELGLKVAISGVGGDELLQGYRSTFDALPRLVRSLRVPSQIPGAAALIEGAVKVCRAGGVNIHPKLAGLLRYGGTLAGAYFLRRGLFLPAELGNVIEDEDFAQAGLDRLNPVRLMEDVLKAGPRSQAGRLAALESCFYLRNQLLRDTDWAGMAHSLEIRTPLTDHILLAKASRVMLKAGRPPGKQMLANIPSKPLPEAITKRRKTGFGVPVAQWLDEERGSRRNLMHTGEIFSRYWARQIMSLQYGVRAEENRRGDRYCKKYEVYT